MFHLNRFGYGAQGQLQKLEEPILLSRELLLCSGPSSDEAPPSPQEKGQAPGGQGDTQEQGQAGTGITRLSTPHASGTVQGVVVQQVR